MKLPLLALAAALLVTCAFQTRADVFTNLGIPASEITGYSLVYTLPLPATRPEYNANAIGYTTDNSAAFGNYYFDRVAYYVELTGSGDVTRPNGYVYSSFNRPVPFVNGDDIGVPANNATNGTGIAPIATNTAVGSMNVYSSLGSITTGTGLAGGKVEFWPSSYGTGANGVFDHDDDGFSGGSGHGSMQVHNTTVPQTLFGFSDSGSNPGGPPVELGIGNNPGAGHPDWTFSGSGTTYGTRDMQVLAHRTANAPFASPALEALDPSLEGYKLVYQEALTNGAAHNGNGVAYDQVYAGGANVTTGTYDRVAYVLELAGSGDVNSPNGFVSVSFDAVGNLTNPGMIGIPHFGTGEFYQQNVSNMNVASNVAGVVTGTGIATGNIEFWSTDYGPSNTAGVPGADGGTFDFGDEASGGGNHGSMQIHNYGAGQTLLAYNNWGDNAGGNSALGIGNNPVGQPDWTFRDNANAYTTKNLYILVRSVPEPGSALLLFCGGLALLTMNRHARRPC